MKTAREMLDEIDEMLAKANGNDLLAAGEAVALGRVLSALRGPDDDNCTLKAGTTEIIRAAAFPKTAAVAKSWSGSDAIGFIADPTDVAKGIRVPPGNHQFHFLDHVRLAAAALHIPFSKADAEPKEGG